MAVHTLLFDNFNIYNLVYDIYDSCLNLHIQRELLPNIPLRTSISNTGEVVKM